MSMLFKRIKDWATSITSFRAGDVIPVDGPDGTAKMAKDDLLNITAHNAADSGLVVVPSDIYNIQSGSGSFNLVVHTPITAMSGITLKAGVQYEIKFRLQSSASYLIVGLKNSGATTVASKTIYNASKGDFSYTPTGDESGDYIFLFTNTTLSVTIDIQVRCLDVSEEIEDLKKGKEDTFYTPPISNIASLTKQKANLEGLDIGDTWPGFGSSTGSRSTTIACSQGDIFRLKSYTGVAWSLWGIIDSSDKILALDTKYIGWHETSIVCPVNSAYLIVNFAVGWESSSSLVKVSEDRNGITDEILSSIGVGLDVPNVFIGASTEYGQGGDQGITQEQTDNYGSPVNDAHVVQYKSRRVSELYAFSGSPASSILWNAGLCPILLNSDITLPKNGTAVSINISTDLACPFGAWTSAYNLYNKDCNINGYDCRYESNTLKLKTSKSFDVVLKAGSEIIPVSTAVKKANCVFCILGSNSQGLDSDTIARMHDFVQKKIKCNHYFVIGSSREREGTSDAGLATSKLKSIYGDHYIDVFGYLCSRQALVDAGITPTTSAEYPDDAGVNSNPLTPTQISEGFIPDMQCFAEQRLPSSFWSVNSGTGLADETHHNAIGYEMKGKYIYRYVSEILGIKI